MRPDMETGGPKAIGGHGMSDPGHDTEEHDHDPVTIYGTNWADEITAGGGPQTILALNGEDIVHAGGGPDEIHGQNGKDQIFAQGGPDDAFGGNGDDYLHGGGGPDRLDGGNGDDILIGCMAADVLTGGRGSDTFVYRAASEAPAHGEEDHTDAEAGHDGNGGPTGGAEHEEDGCGDDEGGGQETITDFKPGTDFIDLSAIGSVTGFSDVPAANSIWAVQQGDDTMLFVDTNGTVEGDHPAEMGILLLGVEAEMLSIDDFIL